MVCEKLVETVKQGFQFSILLRGSQIQGSRLRRKLHIDRFPIGLVGELEVGPVTLGWI